MSAEEANGAATNPGGGRPGVVENLGAEPDQAPFSGAPDPVFELLSSHPVERAAALGVGFRVRVTEPSRRPVFTIALTAVQSVQNAGSSAKVVTFDTNAELVNAIKAGDVQWAVDQQPFLQGYLAVDALWLYLNNRNIVGGGMPTLTGPAFIDQSNIDAVAEYAKNGTR